MDKLFAQDANNKHANDQKMLSMGLSTLNFNIKYLFLHQRQACVWYFINWGFEVHI